MKEKRPKTFGVGVMRVQAVRKPKDAAPGVWYWRAILYRDGVATTPWTGRGTRAEAERAAAEVLAAGDLERTGKERRQSSRTVRDVLELHVGSLEERAEHGTYAEGSFISRRNVARHLVRLMGDRGVEELDQVVADHYARTRLREGAAPATVHLEIRQLRQAWRWGARRKYCSVVDIQTPDVINLDETRRNRYTPSREELGRILAELPAHHWSRIVVAIMVGTGARIGEVAQLRIADVRLEQDGERWIRGALHLTGEGMIGRVRRTGKTGPRDVPIAPELAAEIAAWMSRPKRRPGPALFGVAPSTITAQLQCKYLNPAADRADVPRWSPNATRRSASDTLLGQPGVNLRDYSGVLGHSPETALRNYTTPQVEGMAALTASLVLTPIEADPHKSARTPKSRKRKKARQDRNPDGLE